MSPGRSAPSARFLSRFWESPAWQRWMMVVLLAAAVAVTFGSLLGADFVSWDDDVNITANREVAEARLETLGWFWGHSHQELYMPVVYDAWALLSMLSRAWHGVGALDPHLFHAANLVAHAVSVCFVFLILDLLLGRRHVWAAAAGAALFAVHPMQVEAVAWVTGLKDVLSGALGFWGLWLYLLFALEKEEKRRRIYGAGAMFLYVMALLAKPGVITLPVAAGLIDWLILQRPWRVVARDLWPALIPMAAALLLTPPAELSRLSQVNTPLWGRPLVALDAFWFYLRKFFVPYPLGIDYGRTPQTILERGFFTLTFLVYLVLIAAAAGRSMPRVYWCAIGVAAVALLPTLGLVPFNFQRYSTVADRYAYCAIFGGALALAWLLSIHGRKGWVAALVCVVLIGSGWMSYDEASVWRDGNTLFRRELERNARSIFALVNLGLTYFNEGHYREAEPLYREALKYDPNSLYALNDLGLLLLMSGRNDEAVDRLGAAVRIDPSNTKVLTDYVVALLIGGRVPEAVEWLHKILRAEPENARAHVLLGIALEKQGNLPKALEEEGMAVMLDPKAEEGQFNLGRMLLRSGRTQEAMAVFAESAQALPDSALLLNAYARLLAATPDATARNGALALKVATRACALSNSSDPAYLDTLADAYAETGDFASALAANRQAMEGARAMKHERMIREIEERARLFEKGKPYHAQDAASLFPPEL